MNNKRTLLLGVKEDVWTLLEESIFDLDDDRIEFDEEEERILGDR